MKDYIWSGITGSGGDVLATDRGKVGLSGLLRMRQPREPVADEIVETVFAPLWNANVGDGKAGVLGVVRAHRRRKVPASLDDDRGKLG